MKIDRKASNMGHIPIIPRLKLRIREQLTASCHDARDSFVRLWFDPITNKKFANLLPKETSSCMPHDNWRGACLELSSLFLSRRLGKSMRRHAPGPLPCLGHVTLGRNKRNLKGIDMAKSWPGPGQKYNLLYPTALTHLVSLCS